MREAFARRTMSLVQNPVLIGCLAAFLSSGCYPAREPRWGNCGEGFAFDGEQCVLLTTAKKPEDPLAGGYALTSVAADGAVIAGQATFEPLGPAIYRVRYDVGGASEEGIASLYDGVVSVGVGGADTGVVDYQHVGGGRLSGTWLFHGNAQRGTEVLGGGNADWSGVYAIETGVGPDGASYGGSCDLVVTGDLHTLLWHVQGPGGTPDTYRGLGLRSGNRLSVGFGTGANTPFSVAQYRVEAGGRKLVGRRASWVTTSPKAMPETLTR